MAGQGPSRRELLQALGLASAASVFPGFSRWSYALAETAPQHSHSVAPHRSVRPSYRPQYFSAEQYKAIEVLAELILPATSGNGAAHGKSSGHKPQPGASAAGVAEFIDFMVFNDSSLKAPFRDGLDWLDKAAMPATLFVSLPQAEQNVILERLAYKARHREGEEAGQQFFYLLRKYTVIGFYTSRVGLESLDYPGLTFYGTSPGCTHDGNPEHVGL